MKTKWNKETIKEAISKCDSRDEFRIKYSGAYKVVLKIDKIEPGYFDSLLPNKNKLPRPYRDKHDYNNLEEIKTIASQYKSKTELHDKDNALYRHILKTPGLIDKLYPNKNYEADKLFYIYLYWFKEYGAVYVGLTCDLKQRKRNRKRDKNDGVIVFCKEKNINVPEPIIIAKNLSKNDAKRNEKLWVDYFKGQGYNVINKAKTGLYSSSIGSFGNGRTKEECFNLALRYKNYTEFSKSGLYRTIKKNNWMDEFLEISGFKKRERITFEQIFNVAKQYAKMDQFRTDHHKLYDSAREYGWLPKLDFLKRKTHKIFLY